MGGGGGVQLYYNNVCLFVILLIQLRGKAKQKEIFFACCTPKVGHKKI